jgi:hypothetical protein
VIAKLSPDKLLGLLLIVLIPVLIVSVMLDKGVNTHEQSFEQTVREIVDHEREFAAGMAARLAASLVFTGVAAVSYLVFRRHNQLFALVGSSLFLLLGVTFLAAAIGSFALLDVSHAYEDAHGPGSAMVAASARSLSELVQAAMFVGLIAFLPLGLVTFGALLSWRRVAPRWIGWLGVASGLLMLSIWLSELTDAFWLVAMVGMLGALVWLLVTGAWMLVRGTPDAAAAFVASEVA